MVYIDFWSDWQRIRVSIISGGGDKTWTYHTFSRDKHEGMILFKVFKLCISWLVDSFFWFCYIMNYSNKIKYFIISHLFTLPFEFFCFLFLNYVRIKISKKLYFSHGLNFKINGKLAIPFSSFFIVFFQFKLCVNQYLQFPANKSYKETREGIYIYIYSLNSLFNLSDCIFWGS